MTQSQHETADLNLHPKVVNAMWKEISGEMLIFAHSSRKLFKLNSTGKFIWKLCDGKCTVNDIIDRVAKMYGEEIKKIEEDVINFIVKLHTLDLITWIKL